MVCTSLLALLLVTDWQLYSALPDASDVSLLPALVISNSEERFERSAAMLRTFGFGAMHSREHDTDVWRNQRPQTRAPQGLAEDYGRGPGNGRI